MARQRTRAETTLSDEQGLELLRKARNILAQAAQRPVGLRGGKLVYDQTSIDVANTLGRIQLDERDGRAMVEALGAPGVS